MITGFQLKAAKAVLDLTAQDIAESIGIHKATVVRLCKTKNLNYLSCNVKNLVLIQKFFEIRNIFFPIKDTVSFESFQKLNTKDKITRFQLKVARIAMDLTQEELGFYLQISSSTLSILESLDNFEYIESSKLNIPILKKLFERVGIIFPDDCTVSLTKDPTELVKKSENTV